jgi:hypothetical protein
MSKIDIPRFSFFNKRWELNVTMRECLPIGTTADRRSNHPGNRRVMIIIWALVGILSCFHLHVDARTDRAFLSSSSAWRGGAVKTVDEREAYTLLARALRHRLKSEDNEVPDISHIVKSFKSLSSAQQTFKSLDGAAHEAYQRTHSTEDVDISVSGRALRSAARAGAAADGLGACELCELVEHPELVDLLSPNGTMAGREVLLNMTDSVSINGVNASVLVLYEPSYRGGAGAHHGGIDEAGSATFGSTKGRLVIVISDNLAGNMGATLKVLGQAPLHVRLTQGSATSEIASVQAGLYKAAGSLLEALEAILFEHNSSAIHFVGRSLAGGVASLAASILDGRLPMPSDKKKDQRKKKVAIELKTNTTDTKDANSATIGLQGLGKDRSSAVTLGAPPCVSANVQTDYIISILYGDDVVCRSSKETIDRFLQRTQKALKMGGIVGRQMNWMSDTISLATSNLKSHAHGSEGEEARLSIPGRAYLVRPRRLGGVCSMHEVGAQLKGGREALRAAVFWQLSDVLLTKSLWKHHELESYIQGLDRVQLRGIDDDATTH